VATVPPQTGSNDGDVPPHEPLSDRELILSVRIGGAHRARILEKMNPRNNAELVQYVLTNKVL